MNPALLAVIVQYIALAISGARELEPAIVAAKNFIRSLFSGGLITEAQQDAVHAHVDAIAAAAVAGNPPPEWTVEAYPAD